MKRRSHEGALSRGRRASLLLVSALGASEFGCATPAPDTGTTRPGGARPHDAGPLPAEQPKITVTLTPFHELPLDENGLGEPLDLGGADVCVARQRPYGGEWKDFEEVQGPCAKTEAGKDLVLTGVPGLSELVITAKKDGFRPSVFAVTTGPQDLNMRAPYLATDVISFWLIRADAPLTSLSDVPVRPELGLLGAFALVYVMPDAGGVTVGFLGGARVSVSPPRGNGPFYLLGGRRRPGATRSIPAPFADLSGTLPGSPATWPSVGFVNLDEGEYEVKVEHPGASCSVEGAGRTPVNGYARPGGVIRAPVLADSITLSIGAHCFCLHSQDPRSCGATDSGAP